jgi:ketosteroid isomerase-like protein
MRWVLFLFLLPASAGADVKSELTAAYTRIARAMAAKDIAGVSRNVAPDYQQRSLTGKPQGRAATEIDHRQTFASCKSVEMKARILKVAPMKGGAVAMVNYAVLMVTKPEVDRAGRSHAIVAKVPLKHTWKKTKKGWLLWRSQELPGGTLTMDGKRQKIDRT